MQRNQEELLFYQYNQLERTDCIDNFRILAVEKDGIRRGFFFSDSDAYKWSISRGPLIYSLKDLDNPEANIPKARINLNEPLKASFSTKLFSGIHIIEGKDFSDNLLSFIPYLLWANREKSKMQVYVSEK